MTTRNLCGIVLALGAVGASLVATSPAAADSTDRGREGAVYAITNSPAGNAVASFDRARDGSLTPGPIVPTGGTGNGAGLGSQGAVTLSDSGRLLLAVNPGSNSVSSFRVGRDGIDLVSTAPAGGVLPISVAVAGDLVYVLNAGTPNSISGLRVDGAGRLSPLPGSTRALSADQTNPAQVGFDRRGGALIVTEKGTNLIDTYAVGRDGRPTGPTTTVSAGPTPFGFAVSKRNDLFVSEAGAGGGASSYAISRAGSLTALSSMVMTGQRAACWAVVTDDARYGYVANAGTGNISGFAITKDGVATLLQPDGVTATIGGNPTDTALSAGSRYLYTRVGALGQIAVFTVGDDGSLTAQAPLTGVPATYAGLTAR